MPQLPHLWNGYKNIWGFRAHRVLAMLPGCRKHSKAPHPWILFSFSSHSQPSAGLSYWHLLVKSPILELHWSRVVRALCCLVSLAHTACLRFAPVIVGKSSVFVSWLGSSQFFESPRVCAPSITDGHLGSFWSGVIKKSGLLASACGSLGPRGSSLSSFSRSCWTAP